MRPLSGLHSLAQRMNSTSPQRLFSLHDCTLETLIRAGADWLDGHPLSYGHGTDNALDEAAWIALEACELSPQEPLSDYSIKVTAAQLQRAQQWFRQRAQDQTPVAYLTGRSWFAGLEFATDHRALIPRSPIGELILGNFEPWLQRPPAHVLDLCCGGGCIGIATAVQFPDCAVAAADLSAEALALARQNVAQHRLQQRVTLFHGDLYAALPSDSRYDLIVSNPPYVDSADISRMGGEFHHEPRLGLSAGRDGLDIVRRILAQAARYLCRNGVLVVEVGNSAPALQQLYPEVEFIWLEFAAGGHGVFVLTEADLRRAFPG